MLGCSTAEGCPDTEPAPGLMVVLPWLEVGFFWLPVCSMAYVEQAHQRERVNLLAWVAAET